MFDFFWTVIVFKVFLYENNDFLGPELPWSFLLKGQENS